MRHTDIPWSERQDDWLWEMSVRRVPVKDMATALSRTIHSVEYRLKHLRRRVGIKSQAATRHTTETDKVIRAMFAAGADDETIGAAINRTAKGVLHRRMQLRLHRTQRKRVPRPKAEPRRLPVALGPPPLGDVRVILSHTSEDFLTWEAVGNGVYARTVRAA